MPVLSAEPVVNPAANEKPRPEEVIMRLLFGKHIAFSVSAIARLGIVDHMGSEPVAVDKLARRTATQPDALYRVMRVLAAVGLFHEYPGAKFQVTETGAVLRTDAEGSLRFMAAMFGDRWLAQAYSNLAGCIQTGSNGVTLAYGMNAFDLFKREPESGELFNLAMTNLSTVTAGALLEAYDFAGIARLADVGGGHGILLGSILKTYPQMTGVLFDLPQVVAGAEGSRNLEGCRDRVEIAEGSFFERVPAGCDGYIMKHIIHDWSDEKCHRILSLIREQLPPNGRVLIYEMVITDEPGPTFAKLLDIEMLVATEGGRERSEADFRELLGSAGLRLERIIPTNGPLCVVEARPM